MSARLCYRCGQPGKVDLVDVTSLGDVGHRYVERAWCATPGCAEPNGSTQLDAPSPGELARREWDAWLARQRELARDGWGAA